jgi:hypothetical protein
MEAILINIRTSLVVVFTLLLASACSVTPHVTAHTSKGLPDSADGPYENVLVLALFSKFDIRRYLEDEIVNDLNERGVKAVAATSMMTSRTPLTPKFIIETMTELGSDSLLLTQLADLQTTGKVIDMRPEATYNFRPTYYVNVFTVTLDEYIEPQDIQFTHKLSTSSDLYSFDSRGKVWSMITESTFKENQDHARDYSIILREADAISGAMLNDNVVRKTK